MSNDESNLDAASQQLGIRLGRGVRIAPLGDAALSVMFSEARDPVAAAAARALDAALASAGLDAVVETAPTFRAVLVRFDPLRVDFDQVAAALAPLALAAADADVEAAASRLWRLPTRYDGADLEATAAACGLTQDALIADHAGCEHVCHMVGFLPGCPYLGDLPGHLDLPRLATPRAHVPAGSVAIAAGLTVVYPTDSPGGWRLLGRTPARMFDPHRAPPALVAPGDRVRFDPIDAASYADVAAAAAAGEWTPEPQ